MTWHTPASAAGAISNHQIRRQLSYPISLWNIATSADHRSGSPDAGGARYPGAVPVAYAKGRSCHFSRRVARDMPASGGRSGERPDGNSGRWHAGFGRAASARLLRRYGLVFLAGDRQPDRPTLPTAARRRRKARKYFGTIECRQDIDGAYEFYRHQAVADCYVAKLLWCGDKRCGGRGCNCSNDISRSVFCRRGKSLRKWSGAPGASRPPRAVAQKYCTRPRALSGIGCWAGSCR